MRDARIFLIATEGQSSEPAYFEALPAARWFDPRRVRLEVVPSDERSAPEHVLDRLDDAMARARLLPEDQSWLVADTDRWGDKKLAEVGQLALARGHRLAISRPCWEAWLLLHLEGTSLPSASGACLEALRAALGGYNKNRPPDACLEPLAIARAIAAARALESSPSERWPASPGSHVGRLLDELRLAAPNA